MWTCDGCGFKSSFLKLETVEGKQDLRKLCARCEFLSHVRADYLKRAAPDQPLISKMEFDGMRANTYEFQVLYPRLDTEALLATVKTCLDNCMGIETINPQYKCCTVYEEALKNIFVPLLMERLLKAEKDLAQYLELSRGTL